MNVKFIFLGFIFIYSVNINSVFSIPFSQPDSLERVNQDFEFTFIEGCKYVALENYQLAQELFMKCLELKPLDDGALYNIANVLFIQNDLNGALNYILKAIEVDSKNKWYKEHLTEIYLKLGNKQKAIETYESIVKEYPNDIELYLNLCDLYISAERFKDAIKLNKLIEKEFGMNEQSVLQQASLYSKIGKKKFAYNELKRLISQFPDEVRYYAVLAEAYLNDNEIEKAFEIYNQLLKLDSTNGYAHISMSEYFRMKNDFKKSMYHLQLAFKSHDLDADTKVKIVLSYANSFQGDSIALKQVDTLVSILYATHSDNINVLILEANRQIGLKNYLAAQNLLIKILIEKKDQYNLWQQILYVDNQLLDFILMYKHSNEAIKFFPNQALLYLFKGISGIQTDNLDQSEKALTFGIQLIPDNDPLYIDFLVYLSEVYYKLKQLDRTFKIFDQILEKDPDNLSVLNNYSYYLSLENERLDKAQEMSRKTINKEGENSTFLDTYAWVLFKLKNYSEALVYIEKAISNLNEKNAIVIEHYGDILFKNGKIEEAVRQWNIALTIDPGNLDIKSKIESKSLME